jgi:signal transduction histidine kinase
LPLSDYAVSEIARFLVIDDLSQREALCAHLMSVEPSFTLWSVCRWSAASSGTAADRPFCCVMELAHLLAQHGRRLLDWSPGEGDPPVQLREHRQRWRELSADAVAVANLAADPLADDAAAAEAFLLGLLHNAADWLRSCGPRISIAKRQAGCLPQWLADRLGERSRSARSEAMQQVVRVAKRWRESGRRTREVDGVDVSDALWARRRWQASATGPAAEPGQPLLVALTGKLGDLERLQSDFDRRLEQEKLASLGELAYGASHEINNPLANISTRAQALMTGESDPERRRMLAIINGQALRANEMIADMMLFARPPQLVRENIDLVPLVHSLLDELVSDAELQGTRLRGAGLDDPLWVSADATQLAMAIRAVIVNALQALGADGEVEVRLFAAPAESPDTPDQARIAIRDTGPGIPPQIRRHLFDPFFSGREAGRGMGLGLAKCWRVVTLHGGSIDVTSPPHQGTIITLSLPLVAGEASEAAERDR